MTDANEPFDYQLPSRQLGQFLSDMTDAERAYVSERIEKRRRNEETWPAVPYGYWMGRIEAYEKWLASLDPDERAAEIVATRERYAHHYSELLRYAFDQRDRFILREVLAHRPKHKRDNDRGGYGR